MGILALIAEFENDIRRERQVDGIAKAKDRGVKFGREAGETVPTIVKQTGFSKASIYRALNQSA
jgi:DNA invertase Pin-like site-specific DNA recombinase